MDVKNTFLNGVLHEEAYVKQTKGFEDPQFPNHALKLKKALYGLKQTLKAWYEMLTNFLIERGYKRGEVDKTLVIKHINSDIVVAQIYVDDIVFGSTSHNYMQKFVDKIKQEFEVSMVGELNIFPWFTG